MEIRWTPFSDENRKRPLNASGVAQVGPRRFIFIDNHDPTALFELALDAAGAEGERIQRRPLVGVTDGQLGDPEGLCRVDHDGEIFLIVASSLCVKTGNRSDGLVRVRYTPDGDLQAEAMSGFRAWLLTHEPALSVPGEREPDAGGLNIEGLAWDSRAGALLFGLRGPADPGRVVVSRVPVDAGGAPWTTASLSATAVVRVRIPQSSGKPGIRDISYDEPTGEFLMLLGRSTSRGDEPFQLCRWDGSSDEVQVCDVRFHRSKKPEGITTFSTGDQNEVLIVDDNGGYAVLDYRELH